MLSKAALWPWERVQSGVEHACGVRQVPVKPDMLAALLLRDKLAIHQRCKVLHLQDFLVGVELKGVRCLDLSLFCLSFSLLALFALV